MSGCSVAIRQSRYRYYALLAAGGWVASVFLFLPLAGAYYWLAAALLTWWFYLILAAWQNPVKSAMLHIDSDGMLSWQHNSLPAGQLTASSLCCSLLLLVHWRDAHGRSHRLWLFADQLSAADYRALARHISMQRWHNASKQS